MDTSKRKIKRYEIQIFQTGEARTKAHEKCVKREKHGYYIQVSELQNHLQDDDFLEFIAIRCHLTGMIEVPTEKGTLCGSGFIQKIEFVDNLPCPCQDCKEKGDVRGYGKVTISTALHVIEKERDVKKCKVRLFYDNDDSCEYFIYGLKSHSRDEVGDWCALVCVSHDIEMLKGQKERLERHWVLGRSLKEKYQDEKSNIVIVVSHPHGGPKRVSIGKGIIKDLTREVRDEQDWCYYSYDAITCDGSSGGSVYVLGRWNDGFGYWFGHAHNHCGIDNRAHSGSTVGVDSTHGQIARSFSSIAIDDRDESAKISNSLGTSDVSSALLTSTESSQITPFLLNHTQTATENCQIPSLNINLVS